MEKKKKNRLKKQLEHIKHEKAIIIKNFELLKSDYEKSFKENVKLKSKLDNLNSLKNEFNNQKKILDDRNKEIQKIIENKQKLEEENKKL